MKNFRIIPLLVFVAMLCFSVRVVEIVSGFSDLGGAAVAADAPKTEAAQPPADAALAEPVAEAKEGEKKAAATDEEESKRVAKPPLIQFADDGAETVKPPEHPADAAEPGKLPASPVQDESVEWRDPGDEVPGYEKVRGEIFEDLAKRREGLNQKEKELQTREALIEAAEKELDRKYQELTQLRHEIEKLLKQQSDEETARIDSLVKIYEGMKPKDAARIFDTLDLDILVTVMGKMSERKLSPILAEMNDERARTITIMLAEQKSLPSLPESN